MTTPVDICNLALTAIEQNPIDGLDEDTVSARYCRTVFHSLFRQVLRRVPWTCAGARVLLPAMASAPAFGFAYQYLLPANCLLVRAIPDLREGERWEVDGRLLLTDLPAPLKVKYTVDLALDPFTDTDVAGGTPVPVDPLLANATAMRIAAHLNPRFSGSTAKTAELVKQYDRALLEARTIDATQSVPEVITGSSWVDVE